MSPAGPAEFCRHEPDDPLCLRRGRNANATSADRPAPDGPVLDGTGEAPRIAAERLSGVDVGDAAREAVADLLGPPVGSMPGVQRIATGGAGAALEGLLLEAYRRGLRAAGGTR